jgi:hypothetical protein
MAPSTPPQTSKRIEYNIIKRMRFFDAYARKKPSTGVASIARKPEINIPPSTARYWLRQREKLGSDAWRRTRRLGCTSGPKPSVCEADLNTITDQSNPIHKKGYEDQIKELGLKCAPRTLRRYCAKAGARRFRTLVTSNISAANHQKRVQYGREHQDKLVRDFWQYIWFTDEVHFNSATMANKPEYELRFPGQEQRLESIREEKKPNLRVTVHVAGGISYNHKGPLIFYKDPQEPSEKTGKPRKPRKSKYESDIEFRSRLETWEQEQPEIEIIPKGNAMSQVFYAEKVLPVHIKEIRTLEQRSGHNILFQEDGDPSHGNRSTENPSAQLKKASQLKIHIHPPQSPDLNPIEGLWLIIKQCLRGQSWNTVAEFKAAIQREWDRITITEVRKRISEMPWRCKKVQELEGGRVRSSLW